MGSNLVTKQLLDAQDYAGIEKKVRETIALIRSIRGK
jgi:2-dehydro-3-deoxyphosphogluconate aldolase/(4S)-4-hydroxy-2-oxoglutarate aldolase